MFVWIICLLGSSLAVATAMSCGYPGSPAHASVTFSSDTVGAGTVATYTCDRGFELLGAPRRVCTENGTWTPPGIPFCVLNVAVGKAAMQSSIAQGGFPQKAIDGSTSNVPNPETCTMTEIERSPWWYVNLLEPYMVQLVRVDFGRPCCANNVPATVVVRVGNNRPDVAANPICSRYVGPIEVGRPLFLPCSPPIAGAFVSVTLEGPPGNPLSICETFVYTDQAVPVESCPSFRDQPLGSTATFNGKCYIFYNNQPTNFNSALRVCDSKGGSLIDETTPVLQGFLSWELWQRHRDDPSGQYWMGATRDPINRNNWKWINGNNVTVSFWNLPGGNENCSRFDGTKGWLWSDTNCNLNLNFICQFKPLTCGHPEQPPNSTLIVTSRDFVPSTTIQYNCNPGDLLIGPNRRTCQSTGYYTEHPPTCRHLECGLPAEIPNGQYRLANGTKFYMSIVQYSCEEGNSLVGRADLTCDVDEKWDGPPPRCERKNITLALASTCSPAASIQNGYFASSTNFTVVGTKITYFCKNPSHDLIGAQVTTCLANGEWSSEPPHCAESAPPSAAHPEGGVPGLGFVPALPPANPQSPNAPPQPPPSSIDRIDPPAQSDGFHPINSFLDWFTAPRPTSPAPPLPPSTPPTSAPEAPFLPINPNLFVPLIPELPGPESTQPPVTEDSLSSDPLEIQEVVHTGAPPIQLQPTFPPSTTTTSTTSTTTTPTTTPSTTTTTTTTEPTTSSTTTTTTSTTTTTTTTPQSPLHVEELFTQSTPHSAGGSTAPDLFVRHRPTLPPPQPQPTVTQPKAPVNSISVQHVTTSTQRNDASEEEVGRSDSASGSPTSNARLNTGGIIALSVFGGFVVLAAIITIIVIVYRRKRHPRGSMDNITISTYDSGSGSEQGGLSKYYKRAWENLRNDKGMPQGLGDHGHKSSSHNIVGRQETMDNPNYRAGRGTFEGMRDSNEMTVSDSAAWSTRQQERKPRHHHHHHHSHHHSSGGNNHVDEDREYAPWYNRGRRN